MATLADTIAVDAPPQRVWECLLHLAERYRDWHPDHLRAEWLEGVPNQVGSVLSTVETLHGRPHTLRMRVTAAQPLRRLAYRFLAPMSLLATSGEFLVEPDGERARFTAVLRFRWFAPLFRRRLAGLRQHVHEEGENLKRMVEAGEPVRAGERGEALTRAGRRGSASGRSRRPD
jgi:uncharacterized protein YndB with AHSA1/START domain